jgi:hypothetical protein
MASRLPQKFGIDYVGLTDLKISEPEKLWLKQFCEQLEKIYFLLREDATANTMVQNIVNNNYTGRSAKVQSVAASTISVKLLDENGAETGAAFNVSPITRTGVPAALNGGLTAVDPNLTAGDDIAVFQDFDGEWKTPIVFQDRGPC